jgi:hypothetical protein
MESVLAALKDMPIPTILVIAGIAFLLLSIAGQLAGRIAVAPERQRRAALIGGGLLAIGLALHIVPQLRLKATSPPTGGVPTSERPTPPVKEQPPPPPQKPEGVPVPPSADPVQSYRIRTHYLPATNVEFSVFVNDVQVGAYSASGVTADITQFIKPGANKVRIAWTTDNMGSYAALFIRGETG